MKLFKKKKGQFISQVVILAMVFGFAAGVVGQIVADVYLDPWRDDYINQSLLNTNQDIFSIIPELKRVKKFLGIEQDFEVDKSISKVAPALVGIYPKKPASSSILNQIYSPLDLRANGFILTSDGWVVSGGRVFASFDPEQLVVIYDNQVFDLEETITDSTTGVVFLKIPASNLPVVVLGDSDEAISGQLAVVPNDLAEVAVVNIESTDYWGASSASDFVVTSEEYGQLILLFDSLEGTYLGSPLVNLGGEVIGLIKEINPDQGLVIVTPINQFRSIILDILRSNIIKRPFLGVDYIDLAWVVGLDQEITRGLDNGALVYQKPRSDAPAAEIDLQVGDIILSVDGQQIDKDSSLTELIQQYQPGDEIVLEVLRDGKIFNQSVILAILPD